MDRFGLCVFVMIIILGLFIRVCEVDQKPDPRALYNTAWILMKDGDVGKAHFLYGMCAQYNLFFGTHYENNEKPQGLAIAKATKNYLALSHLRQNYSDEVILKRLRKQWGNEY